MRVVTDRQNLRVAAVLLDFDEPGGAPDPIVGERTVAVRAGATDKILGFKTA